MTAPVFLTDLPDVGVGDDLALDGEEGHHAATVRRIGVGETIVVSDGAGRGVSGKVTGVAKRSLTLRVEQVVSAPEPPVHIACAQALAKGGHDEQAIDMMTQAGISEVIPWQAARAIVRWSGERATKGQAKWQRTVREATKQSRRLRVPEVAPVATTGQLAARAGDFDRAFVLHESADLPLGACDLAGAGSVLFIVGPEGGLTPQELQLLREAGAQPVTVNDGVLRASTAGLVGLVQLQMLTAEKGQ